MKLSDLVGTTVAEARLMTEDEQEDFGWYEPGVVLGLTGNGEAYTALIQCDPEGNGPGALVVFNNADEEDTGYFGKG